jgi:uridylate kinase
MNEADVSPDRSARPRWNRVVLKLSGEALADPATGNGLSAAYLSQLAAEIIECREELRVDMAVVVGGGNFWRGRVGVGTGMDPTQSDHMGMLGTVINALALQDALERTGTPTRVLSAVEMPKIAEPYIRRRAIRHLEKGRVVIFAAGTGNPFFTTDTAAALRAAEIEADAILKGTHSGVDGVYDADPRTTPEAVRYETVSHFEVISRDLKVMDSTAIAFCRDNAIPIVVFDVQQQGNIRAVLEGRPVGTLVA